MHAPFRAFIRAEEWQFKCSIACVGRLLIILIALIWIVGTTAFFLFVPVLPLVTTGLIVFGFGLMFVLGVHVGHKPDFEQGPNVSRKFFPNPEQIAVLPPAPAVEPIEYAGSLRPGA